MSKKNDTPPPAEPIAEKPPVDTPPAAPAEPAKETPPPPPVVEIVTEKTSLVEEMRLDNPAMQAMTDGVLPPGEPMSSGQPTAPVTPLASAEAPPPLEPESPEPGETATPNAWVCPKCPDCKYNWRSYLTRHIKRVHPAEADTMIAALPAGPTGRKAGGHNAKKPDFSDINNVTATAATGTDYQFMSEMIFDMTTGSLAGMLGNEWLPREDSPGSNTSKERANVVMCISKYLKSKEVKDIPPGVMLTIVCCAYAGPRIRQPATLSKIKAGWFWLKAKFQRKKPVKLL